MKKYQLDIPIPSQGINCLDESLIADNEAAYGTKNISFKDGIPQTRKGVNYAPVNEWGAWGFGTVYTPKPLSAISCTLNGVYKLLFASGTSIKKQTNYRGTNYMTNPITHAITPIINNDNVPYYDGVEHLNPVILDNAITVEGHGYIDGDRIRFLAYTGTLPTPLAENTVYFVKNKTVNTFELAASLIEEATTIAINTSAAVDGWVLFKENINSIASGMIETLVYPFKFSDPDVFSEKLFILDGTNYRYYNGAAIKDVLAYVPSAEEIAAYGDNALSIAPDEVKKQKYILNDDNRIWLAGYGKLVRMSHLQTPNYLPSTHVWKLREDCTGMGRFMGEVVLFTENTATLISGSTPDFSLPEKYIYKELPTGYGTSQHRSIVVGNNAMYWANPNGVYRYRYLPTGFSIPECVTEYTNPETGHHKTVKKYMDLITDWTKVFAVFFDNEYRLHLGGGKWLVYDTIGNAWAYFEYSMPSIDGYVAMPSSCAYVYDNKLYCADTTLYQYDFNYNPNGDNYEGLSDNSAEIENILKSKVFSLGKEANPKRFSRLYFTLFSDKTSYNIDLSTNFDNNFTTYEDVVFNRASRWGQMCFGDKINTSTTNLNYRINVNHQGKKFNMQYVLKSIGTFYAWSLINVNLILKIKELR